MKHTSRLFGDFTYNKEEIITFPSGLLGYSEYREYVLRDNPATAPIRWLLSVEDEGPELALIDPRLVGDKRSLTTKLDARMLAKLHCEWPEGLQAYAIVTLPDNIRQMSMNLRSPVFINPAAMRGLQYPKPGIERNPVRRPIYGDLVHARPTDKLGTIVMLRKENETIEIGNDVTVQILDFVNGGVRVSVTAPRRTHVGRGAGKVTPLQETKRANEHMNLKNLAGIMSLYRIGEETDTEDTLRVHSVDEEDRVEAV